VNTKKKFPVFILAALFVFMAVSVTFAHNLVIEPGKFTVPQGETVGICWTFTEVIGTPEYSSWVSRNYVFPEFMETPVEVRYKNKTPLSITDTLRPYDWGSREIVEGANSDSDYAEFTVTQPGTVVIEGKFRGKDNQKGQIAPPGVTVTTRSHMKTFLNLTNDDTATQRIGGDEFLEIVFAEDVAEGGPKVGDKVKFQVFLDGAPLQNEKVFAAYSGAPSYPVEEDGREVFVNECMIAVTDSNGLAEFMFDREAGWFVGTFAYPEDYLEYGGAVMFYVSDRSDEPGGRSGCNALGAGALAFLTLAAGLGIKKTTAKTR
jgi:uncharacterized GH25 family protein